MKDINNMLKGMDPKTLEEGKKRAEEFAKTQEGKKLLDSLGLTGKFSADSLKKVSDSDFASIQKFISSNPSLAKKIENILKKE